MYIHQYLIDKIGKDCFGIVNDYLIGEWKRYYLDNVVFQLCNLSQGNCERCYEERIVYDVHHHQFTCIQCFNKYYGNEKFYLKDYY